jgi:opacity protein-like surface antigen
MKKVMISLTALLIALFLTGNLYSQSNFSLHVGPSFPLSDFGDDDMDDDDTGGAGVGISLGGKYTYKLNDNGLGLYLGADFNYNGLKSSVKDDIEDEFDDMGVDVDITYIKYVNIPITAGLNYTFKANDQVSLFGDLGIGADFFKVTNMTFEANNEEMEVNYKLSTQLAYKIGGGLMIKDKYIIGIHYNGLGEHDLKGEMKYDGDTEDLDDSKLKVSLLTFTFGIKF